MSLPAPGPQSCVLVTGASSGIGTELARRLAELGYDLVLAARRAERLEALAEELRAAHGVEVLVVPVDLTQPAERAELIAALAAGDRAVVGVCNDAGFGLYGRTAEQDPERLRAMVALNVDALHHLTLAFLPGMLERGEGAILNVASIAAFQPLPGFATYAATKAFVQTFSEALHAELRGSGVSCTVLSPGPVATEFGEVAGTDGVSGHVPGFVEVSPHEVAAAGVKGMLRGRRSVVPGIATKALATGGRFVPRTVLLPVAHVTSSGGRSLRRPEDESSSSGRHT
jgi:short-subunit dehydrogenase